MKKHETAAEFLRCAKRLVRKGWAQGRYAQSKSGRQVDVMSRSATKFCMIGAMLRCDGDAFMPSPLYMQARRTMAKVVPHSDVARYNDAAGRKKSEVLAMYDTAIALVTRD